MARENDDRPMDAPQGRASLDGRPGAERESGRPAMGTADLVAAAEGRPATPDRSGADAARRDPALRPQDTQALQQVETRVGQDAQAAGGAGAAATGTQPPTAPREALAALFEPGAASAFRERWREVQVGFVDDPRQAVAHADELVAQVMKSLAESFARQRSRIEAEVGQGEAQASTENLRVALTRYRSFFERLLSL